jgi:hypothetical protein
VRKHRDRTTVKHFPSVAPRVVFVVLPSWSGGAASEIFDREDLSSFIDRVGTVICVSSVCGLTSA